MVLQAGIEARERFVSIPIAGGGRLQGDLSLPEGAGAVVVFAHGGGSNRSSPRNRFIAGALREAGLATLLFDLLVEGELDERRKMFDIELQADRVQTVENWLARGPEARGLRLGCFGAGTGAAVVLKAAAQWPKAVGAIVCRGGWIDLARNDLPLVKAPTLLIVGGRDPDILEINRHGLSLLRCPKELAVISDATHFFPELGTLEEVAGHTTHWFVRYLAAARTPSAGGPSHPAGEAGIRR